MEGAIGGNALFVVCIVCLRFVTSAFVVPDLSFLNLWCGSLALGLCLSVPRVSLGLPTGGIGCSVSAVLSVVIMSVLFCLPGGRSLGAAVGLVFCVPQGAIVGRSEPGETRERWAMCCAAVPLQDESKRFPQIKTSIHRWLISPDSLPCNGMGRLLPNQRSEMVSPIKFDSGSQFTLLESA